MMERALFNSSRLTVIGRASEDVRTQIQVSLGDFVVLNSGSPKMLIVDIEGEMVIAAVRDKELKLPRPCFTRLSG